MFRNYVALWASIAVLAFFYIGHYVFGRDAAKTVMDSLVIGSAVTISLTWFASSIGALRSGVRDGAANILVSTWMIWTVLLGYFVYVRVYSYLDRPAWLLETPAAGTFSTLIFLAGAYAILVPINDRRPLPMPNFIRWVVGVGAGMFVAGVLMTLAFLKIVSFG